MSSRKYMRLFLNQGMGGLLGTSGGAAGTGFNAPQAAAITSGATPGQVGSAIQGANTALSGQAKLLSALQGQQGLQDQVIQASAQNNLANQLGAAGGVNAQAGALQQQQALNAQLAGANGVGNQSSALASQQALAGQQQGLASQYANVAAGQGPNPALAALNQATGQNVANQSALMAGQRGASANVGLMARQAAQQGAATQQQAVGQAATTQAQQSLAAMSGEAQQQQAIGATQQNVANIAAQQIGAQQAGVGAQQQMGANITAQQQAQQQMVANEANIMAQNQIGATGAVTGAQQAQQAAMQGALGSYNQSIVSQQGNINSANAGLAQTQLQGQQGVVGGVLQGAGAALGLGKAQGGMIEKPKAKKFAYGGGTTQAPQVAAPIVQAPVAPAAPGTAPQGPQSVLGQFLQGMGGNSGDPNNAASFGGIGANKGAQSIQKGMTSIGAGARKMALTPGTTAASPAGAMAGPDAAGLGAGASAGAGAGAAGAIGELAPLAVMAASKGGLAKKGGHVAANKPDQKAEKKGNSYDNDKIPAYLSEGEVVIPRSVMQGKDPARGAADFVAQVLAKKGMRR